MRFIFKLIFERFVTPFGLPISPMYEYMILLIIGAVAFRLAYFTVGVMYRRKTISGKLKGSFFHWFFRALYFFGLWLITYEAIQVYYFFNAN